MSYINQMESIKNLENILKELKKFKEMMKLIKKYPAKPRVYNVPDRSYGLSKYAFSP